MRCWCAASPAAASSRSRKRLGVLHALREFGVPVYNDARAIERSVDKSMTSLLLHAAAHPDAADLGHRIGGAGAARRDARGRGRPCAGAQAAVRLAGQGPAAGRRGRRRAPPRCRRSRRPTAGSPTCSASCRRASDPGFDWRVLVVGGRAVTAMRRVSEHWVHNVAQGARCEPAPLEPPLARLAEDAARGARARLRRRRHHAQRRCRATAAGDRGQRRRGLAGPAARDRFQHRARASSTTCSTASSPPRRRPARAAGMNRAGVAGRARRASCAPASSTWRCASPAT